MANEYRHKRYFRIKVWDPAPTADFTTDYVFQSVADANEKIVFNSVFDTSSPVKTEALENDNKTFVVTYEFDTEADQTAFKTAIDNGFTNIAGGVYTNNFNTYTKAQLGLSGDQTGIRTIKVEHFKTEWLHDDGSVSQTTNL